MRKTLWKQWILVIALMVLGTIGSVSTVNAEYAQDVCGPIDCTKFTGDVDEPQYHWNWNYATKTLTLSGVNMEGYKTPYNAGVSDRILINLPAGSTVIATPGTVNTLKGRFSSNVFHCVTDDCAGNTLTITGEGTYNISRFECGFRSEASKTIIKNTTINFENGDACYLQSECLNQDAVTILDHAKITVKECTGGFYSFGSYKGNEAITASTTLYKNSFEIIDSDLDMDIVLDKAKERNHSCFLIRNGYLKLVRSSLKLKSYHTAVIVWQESPAKTTITDDLIQTDQEILQTGIYRSTIQKEIGKNHYRAETFSPDGKKMDFTFHQSGTYYDLSFGHQYTNAVTELSMTVPNITVSYNSMGGNEIAAVSGRAGTVTVETLPVPEKAGYSFLGWSETPDSGNYITTLTNVTKDMTLYANWKEKANTATNPSKTSAAKTFTKGSITYQYINKTTVKVVKIKSKKIKNITIPATVKVKGKKYKVTTIGANTFANCKNLKKVVLGKYVVKIEKKAFYKCKKLAYIQINSKKLKSVGTKAIYGIQKKAKIVCDKKCVKKYKKLFKKKTGFKKPMSVKKKK